MCWISSTITLNYRDLNFYGGTCLHILYGLNRLSEDIDLDNSDGLSLDHFVDDLLDYFTRPGTFRRSLSEARKVRQGFSG